MLNLNYYLVETGENYCVISKHNRLIDMKEVRFKGKDTLDYKLGKLLQKSKRSFFKKETSKFKVVYVDKREKLCFESYVKNGLDGPIEGPIFTSEDYDVYVVKPGQNLQITYKVYSSEIENRFLSYPEIKQTTKTGWNRRNQ